MARSLPAWICDCSGCITAKIICVSPCTVDSTAGGEPLKGTCTASMPAIDFSSSALRCDELPLPTDAKLSLPGLALAQATRSATDLIGRSAFTASTFGWLDVMMMGARSFFTS